MRGSGRVVVFFLVGLAAGALAGRLLGSGGAAAPEDAPWDDVNRSVFAVSSILIPVESAQQASGAAEAARRAYEELARGADFGEVARRVSRDPSASEGGFMGFLPPDSTSPLSMIVRALRPGRLSFPVRTREGYLIVKRHTFEEGRQLEQRHHIPAYGVFVPWEGVQGGESGVTKEEALQRARDLVAGLNDGTLTLEAAAQRLSEDAGDGPRRVFLGVLSNRPETARAFAALKQVGPGAVVGPIEEPHGWAVLRRAPHFRALLKHILIQHLESVGRDIGVSRTRAEARKLAADVLAEVRNDPSRWSSAVERFSDDRQTIPYGGSLGVVQAGELPSGLNTAIFDAQPGRIHGEVLESIDGYHVVWYVQ